MLLNLYRTLLILILLFYSTPSFAQPINRLGSNGTQILDTTVSYTATTAANTTKTTSDITSTGALYYIVCIDNDITTGSLTVTLNNKETSFNSSDQYISIYNFSVAANSTKCATAPAGWMPSGTSGQVATSNDAISDGSTKTVAIRVRSL